MADADYDRGVLAGQESLDRELDACKDTIESLREQLEEERRRLADVKQARYHESGAAEAKLAEDAHRNEQLKRERDKYRDRLAEVEEQLRIERERSGDEPDAVDKWLENKRPVKPIPLPPVDDLLSGDE